MKTCRNCGEAKVLSAFYKHSRMADGHLNFCKECVKARIRAQSAGNPKVKERDRRRNKSADRIAAHKQRMSERPWLSQAKRAVHRAIAKGELAPATACECNDCRAPAAVLHHHSYEVEHLLDVVPLCRSCHGIRHAYPERF